MLERAVYPYPDSFMPGQPRFLARHVLPTLDVATEGAFSETTLSGCSRILDLGCGYGAYGAAIRALNPECLIVGVDVRKYTPPNHYAHYDRVYVDDIASRGFWNRIEDRMSRADLILGAGLPVDAQFSILHTDWRTRPLAYYGAMILLLIDHEPRYLTPTVIYPFDLYHSRLTHAQTILLHRREPRLPKPR